MLRTAIATGVGVAAVLGAGTGALALSGAPAHDTSGSATAAAPQRLHRVGAALRHAVHGQVVTHGKDGYVRHDGVIGTVTAVSAHAITVKAADGYTETFVVTPTTRVRKRTNGTGSSSTISAVKTGDKVAVAGRVPATSHASVPARFVVDGITR